MAYLVIGLALDLTSHLRNGWSKTREDIFLNLVIGNSEVKNRDTLEGIASRVGRIPEGELKTITFQEFNKRR